MIATRSEAALAIRLKALTTAPGSHAWAASTTSPNFRSSTVRSVDALTAACRQSFSHPQNTSRNQHPSGRPPSTTPPRFPHHRDCSRAKILPGEMAASGSSWVCWQCEAFSESAVAGDGLRAARDRAFLAIGMAPLRLSILLRPRSPSDWRPRVPQRADRDRVRARQ